MRIPTLRSLLTENLEWYLESNYPEARKSKNDLLKLSVKDHRIAVLAQGYFISLGEIDKANEFAKYTYESFKSIDDYINSDTKYALEYKDKTDYNFEDKNMFMNRINKVIFEYSISHYSISKSLNIPQQNISSFFNKKNYKTLSNKKLMEILKYVNQKAKEIESKKI